MQTTSTKGSRFLPELCHPLAVFSLVVGAELFAIVMSIYSTHSFSDFVQNLGLSSLFVQWAVLTWLVILCLLRHQLMHFSAEITGLIAWLILIMTTFFVSIVSLSLSGIYLPEFSADISPLKNTLIAAIVSAMVLRYLYIHYQWKQQIKAESRAQFDALQARIRPHFLFNSMNTIANLTHTNPDLAEEIIYDLSDLFRASLINGERTSTLKDEIEILKGYIRIESQRIGDRMEVTWDVDDLPDEPIRIPSLLIQPLIENAVYHGIQPAVKAGFIHIKASYQEGFVKIRVHNSLPSKDEKIRAPGNQMAQENIRQRLAYFFHQKATLDIEKTTEHYTVNIRFPHPWNAL